MTRYTAVFLAIALLAPGSPAAPALRGKLGYYHATKEGDKSVYEMRTGDSVNETVDVITKLEYKGDTVIVFVEREVKGVVQPNAQVEVSEKGVVQIGIGERKLADPRPMLKLPAKPRDQWTFESEGPAGAGRFKTTCTVGKEEEVEVPAGKFRAIRVDCVTTLPGAASHLTIEGSAWFAPRVGIVKHVSNIAGVERTQVLKSFTPGK
jgi:hypothetical protein